MVVQTASRTEEAIARSAAYRLLSQALVYPTADAACKTLDEDLPLAESVADALPVEVGNALGEMASALRGAERHEMEVAYGAALSHVHSADCSAFESDYLEGDLWRRAHQLADIAGFYRAFGVSHPSERPDHVAVELEFLHLVSCKLAWALGSEQGEHAEVCAAAEDRFLTDHVLRWMPGFAARLARTASAGPLRSVARMLAALLRAQSERVGVEPSETNGVLAPEPEPGGMCEEDG